MSYSEASEGKKESQFPFFLQSEYAQPYTPDLRAGREIAEDSRLDREQPGSLVRLDCLQVRKPAHMQWTLQEGCDCCGAERCAFLQLPDGMLRRLCTDSELSAMLDAYIACALWSSTDPDTQEPLDDGFEPEDLDNDRWLEMLSDCDSFRDSQAADLEEAGLDMTQAGHDFWLTRNGHGTGFWDRGLGAVGDRLSKASKPYGSIDLIPLGNGKVG